MSELCFCGFGFRKKKGGGWILQSHAPDCLWLHWLITLEEDDVCGRCGEPFFVQRGGTWKRQECRTCKTYRMELIA